MALFEVTITLSIEAPHQIDAVNVADAWLDAVMPDNDLWPSPDVLAVASSGYATEVKDREGLTVDA